MDDDVALRDVVKKALEGKGVLAQIRVRRVEEVYYCCGCVWIKATAQKLIWTERTLYA